MRPHLAEKNLRRRAKQPTRSHVLYEVLDGSLNLNGGTHHEKDSECAGCGGPGGRCGGGGAGPPKRPQKRNGGNGNQHLAGGGGGKGRKPPAADVFLRKSVPQ